MNQKEKKNGMPVKKPAGSLIPKKLEILKNGIEKMALNLNI